MKTRTKKWEEKRYLLKRESNQIEYIVNNAIEDNANDEQYRYVFDEIMGNPMEKLDELMDLPRVYRGLK